MAIAEYEYPPVKTPRKQSGDLYFVDRPLKGTLPDEVRLYLDDIKPYQKLEPEQEIVLAQQLEADKVAYERTNKQEPFESKARTQLILHTTGLVVGLAVKRMKRGTNGGLSLMDLIQIGNIGLVEAVDTYDYRKGRLGTHATWHARAAMYRKVHENKTLSMTQDAREIRLPKLATTIADLERIAERELTFYQKVSLATILFKDEFDGKDTDIADEAEALVRSLAPSMSIDTPIAGMNNIVYLKDIISDPHGDSTFEEGFEVVRARDVQEELATLPHPLPEVINSVFGLQDGQPKSLAKVAKSLGRDIFRGNRYNKGKHVSRQRVDQLRKEGLSMLRERARLRSYYDES